MTAPDRPRRRGYRPPGLEPLEARELLSFTLVKQPPGLAPTALAALASRVEAAPQPGPAAPTSHEARRQKFSAKFVGPYTVGPGRYTDQAGAISATGSGTSSDFLHGGQQLRITLPGDPTASATGVIAIFPTNVATTGSTLILELTEVPGATARGLPTRFTWTVSPASGGAYQNAGGYGEGRGTLTLLLTPKGGRHVPVTESGHAAVFIQGSINKAGIFSDLGVPGNGP